MRNSIINPEPPDNPAIRRQMFQLAAFAAVLLSALLAAMISSFVGILPNWVGWAANLAIALTTWLLARRSEFLRRRLKAQWK
jgi:membrane protein YdbS with pleckstrin-like domain